METATRVWSVSTRALAMTDTTLSPAWLKTPNQESMARGALSRHLASHRSLRGVVEFSALQMQRRPFQLISVGPLSPARGSVNPGRRRHCAPASLFLGAGSGHAT